VGKQSHSQAQLSIVGDAKLDAIHSQTDRPSFLSLVLQAISRQHWVCRARLRRG